MFGEHLISEKQDCYLVVESEKTAIIMSLEMPKFTWVSVNGKGDFNHNLLENLKNKRVVAYPDKGCFQDWESASNNLNNLGFNIVVSKVVEESLILEGEDIADFFLRYKAKGQPQID